MRGDDSAGANVDRLDHRHRGRAGATGKTLSAYTSSIRHPLMALVEVVMGQQTALPSPSVSKPLALVEKPPCAAKTPGFIVSRGLGHTTAGFPRAPKRAAPMYRQLIWCCAMWAPSTPAPSELRPT